MNQKNPVKSNPYSVKIKQTTLGVLTTLTAEKQISVRSSIGGVNLTLIASTVYNQGSRMYYTTIDTAGNEEIFMEEEYMILPTLFLDPNQRNFVSVAHIPSKEMEITLPVFNRDENLPLPKANRPFVGEFVGVSNQFSILYNVDSWSKDKPDKMLAIEFNNGTLKKKHNVKIEFPNRNKIYISNNEIHLLGRDNDTWWHRQINEKGKVIRQKEVFSDRLFYWEAINLSFESDSYLIYQNEEKTYLEKIDTSGKCTSIELIHLGNPFYSTWRPVQIAEKTVVMNFTSEFGNGWLTIKDDQLIELYYQKGVKGYKNWITNEIIELSEDDLIINGIQKTGENSYSVTFYHSKADRRDIRKILVLNRTLNK